MASATAAHVEETREETTEKTKRHLYRFFNSGGKKSNTTTKEKMSESNSWQEQQNKNGKILNKKDTFISEWLLEIRLFVSPNASRYSSSPNGNKKHHKPKC